MQSKWNCTIIALAMAMMLGAVDIHAVCENATSNAEWWPGDVKFSYSTVTCKGKVEEQIISETSDLIDSVTVPCNVTETTPTITKTITTGASGTLSVSGTLTLGASATAEAGIAGFGKVGGTTSVSSSVTVGANGTISSTESVSVTCNWTVPPCLNWQGEMRQDVKEFTTIQKITQCTKRTITALPSNPARVGESVLRGPLKTAQVTIEGNVRRGKSCSDMILGPCPDKKDGTGIPQESVTESGEKPDDDQDGSPNDEENYRGTDPYNPDTDEDGLSDPVDPCPLDPDCDGDSVEDGSEVTALNTDPQNADSDDDGIRDNKDVFPTLNPNPTINLYDVFPSGNVTGLGSSGREVLISGILEPFPPVLEVVVGGNLMVVFPTDKTFSLAPIELTPGAHTVNFYAVSGNGESANREAIGSVDFQLQQDGPCLFCQDVVDDTLDRACQEFAASPPTSEAGMANTALDIFNEILSTAELCDAGQSVGGSAAACQDDLFRLLGVSLPVPEKVAEVILGFTFVETNQEGYPEYRHDSTDIRFVRLPGGSFDMGSPAEEPGHSPDQGPVHTVTLSPFLIAKYEVMQAEYESVMTGNTSGLEASPSSDKGDKLPVVRVSWDDLYLEDGFLERTGLVLPSEAQWEYACRAGTSGAYAGNGVLDDMGWFLDNSGGTSHEVGGKRPNQFGLHDMYGNVLEWCEDVYRERFYDEVQDGLDPVSKSGQDVSPYELRVMRGGAFDVAAQDSRSSSRFSDMRSAPLRRGSIGFRPARPLPVIEPEPEPEPGTDPEPEPDPEPEQPIIDDPNNNVDNSQIINTTIQNTWNKLIQSCGMTVEQAATAVNILKDEGEVLSLDQAIDFEGSDIDKHCVLDALNDLQTDLEDLNFWSATPSVPPDNIIIDDPIIIINDPIIIDDPINIIINDPIIIDDPINIIINDPINIILDDPNNTWHDGELDEIFYLDLSGNRPSPLAPGTPIINSD